MEEILSKLNEIQNQLDDLEGKMVEVHGYLWGSEGLGGSPLWQDYLKGKDRETGGGNYKRLEGA